MNTCQKCGKDYYSDTEFEQHLFMHKQDEFLEYAKANAGNLAKSFNDLCFELEVLGTSQLYLHEGLTYAEAAKQYLELRKAYNEAVIHWRNTHPPAEEKK